MKAWLVVVPLACGFCAAAQVPALRDPMQPPVAPRTEPPTLSPDAAPAAPSVRHLLVIGEKRWVVQGGRRHGIGDTLGSARIERIEDSAVVVRQGGALQRLPLYAGITKQAVAAPVAPVAASAASRHTRTALAAPAAPDRLRR